MRVSVIMPVFNKQAFVKEAIESLSNGKFSDLEIVAVDDHSTDGSLNVLQSIKDPRLKVIPLPKNLGTPGAAQTAIDAAQGEYLLRLDADDIAAPDRIAKQVEFMDSHPEIGASGGHVQLFGDADSTWKFPITNAKCQAQLLFGVPVSQGASIMRRSVLLEHDIRYDPSWPNVGEDWLFWTRLSRVTQFGNMNESVIFYRRGDHNISFGRDKRHDHGLLFKQVFEFFGIPLSDDELKLHFLTMKHFMEPPDRHALVAFKAWLTKLKAMNAERDLFPEPAFAERVDSAWNELFHYLPQRSVAAALEHMRLSGEWPKAKVIFLAKTRLNTLLGRK